MSIPEASTRPPSPSPLKPEANPRPSIPPKPSSQNGSPLNEEGGGSDRTSGSQVKRIVDRFSPKKTEPSPAGAQTVRSASVPAPCKAFKRAPTVKPKPVRQRLQNLKEGDRVPPLPMKRRHIPLKNCENQTETPGGVEGNGVNIEGGRSAPDGKEVELNLTGGDESEAERGQDAAPSARCEPHCSCLCHLQRPGMKLVWVPEDSEEGEEVGEEEEEDIYEQEVETREREAVEVRLKKPFHHMLDAIIGDSGRRRSDPGPPAAVCAAIRRPRSPPPAPPRRTSSPLHHSGSLQEEEEEEEEEENIYEDTLFVTPPARPACQELDIPLIRVLKPLARHSKTSSASSGSSTEFHAEPQSDVSPPPALPPRVPLPQDKGTGPVPASVPRGGILLPQPTAEERRSLMLSSPGNSNNNTAAGSGSAAPQRPASPLMPCRAAPPPPCHAADSRRLSHVSMETKEPEAKGPSEGEREGAEEERPPVAPPRRASSFRSRLQDEPLYQTYRASVITKEIRRQTVYRSVSKASADYTMDWGGRRAGTGNGVARGGTGLSSSQSTLWQELPAVRDSGVLQTLSAEDCKYQESMFEVLTSEASYLRSLCVLTEHFHDSRELEDTLIIRDRKTLFSNVLRVREISERFLKHLEERMDESLVLSDICDIIHYHSQHNFHAYIDYVRNQIYQEKTYTSLMKNNLQFASVITRLQESPQCQRLPFMSFLLLPFQRITRIKMLIENILKRTKEGTKEERSASKALGSVSKIIAECNTEVGKMKQVEELIHLSKMLEFDKLKAIPIISQTRHLEKKGELQEMSKGGTIFNSKAKFTPIFLFLFNDLLIVAAKKGADRFVVLDHAHRSLVQVQPLEDGAGGSVPHEHCFVLTLLENHQGKMMERLIKAPSQSDVARWIAAFPNPSNPDGNEDEVIYEDWDCPQVQCVEQYLAQQADELNLEPTEIVNIVRKANEGLYEGIRLSDGQRGWFPVANVLEITNEHVRRRNLRERYRVMQAATAMATSKGLAT